MAQYLANYEGAIYAVSGICRHQLNPLEGATMWGPLVDCPWHNFDLQHPRKQVAPLKRYAIEIRDGEVWVDIE